MVDDKAHILQLLQEEYTQWEDLLADMSETQLTDTHLPGPPPGWSVKDVLAHLWGWQQLSVARAHAALQNSTPAYPQWTEQFGPDPEEDVDRTNAWIYESNRDRPWSSVYADWRAGFGRFVELAAQIPAADLLTPGRYAWMGEYSLADSLQGSYEHHQEHRDALRGATPE
jgi:hypothetical protein